MPCKHILKLREIYKSPAKYSTYTSRKEVYYASWLYETCNINLVKYDCDREFVMTIYNLCKNQIHSEVISCDCEGEDTIRYLRNRINELENKLSCSVNKDSAEKILKDNKENYNKL
jgi:hypothetical protein